MLTESTFSLPGHRQVRHRRHRPTNDLPKVLGVVLVGSLFIIMANLIVDLLYAVVDPRVRTSMSADVPRAPTARARSSSARPARALPAPTTAWSSPSTGCRSASSAGRRWASSASPARASRVTSMAIMGLHTARSATITGEIWLDGEELRRRRPGAGAPAARQQDGDDLPGPAVRDAPVLHGGPTRSSRRTGCTTTSRKKAARRSTPSTCSAGSASRSRPRGSTTTRTSSPAACGSAR